MNEALKRVWNWLNETGPLLSTAPAKTADGELSPHKANRGVLATHVAGEADIAPSGPEIGFPEAIDEKGDHQPTIAKVNAIRLNLAQRIVFERDARRSRTANVMRSASDMLGYLSRELTAQDRRLFGITSDKDMAEQQYDALKVEFDRLKADWSREVTLRGSIEQRLATMTASEQGHRKRIEVVEGERNRANELRIMAEEGMLGNATLRDEARAEVGRQTELARVYRRIAARLTSTLTDVRNYLAKEDRFAPTVKIIDNAIGGELVAPAFDGTGQVDKLEEFDVTKPRDVRQDALLAVDVLNNFTDPRAPFTVGDAGRIVIAIRALLGKFDDAERQARHDREFSGKLDARLRVRTDERDAIEKLANRLENERDAALARVTALSQPRIVNVAGLVDADLAERYESLRQSFAKVSTYSDDKLKDCEDELLTIARQVGTVGLTLEGGEGPRKRGVVVEAILRKAGLRSRGEDPAFVVEAPTYGETERNAAINAASKHGVRINAAAGWENVDEIVDLTARTLGMRRAGA